MFLGIFGTIVGFYFGSEIANLERPDKSHVVPPILSEPVVESGGLITLTAAVVGGSPPYRFGVQTEDGDISYNDYVEHTGWFSKTVPVKTVTKDEVITLRIGVKDQSEETLIRSVQLRISVNPDEAAQ